MNDPILEVECADCREVYTISNQITKCPNCGSGKIKKEEKSMNGYQERQANCKCLKPDRRIFISEKMDFSKDFNDGAFLAYMEENGIDVSDLEPFSIEHNCCREIKNGVFPLGD